MTAIKMPYYVTFTTDVTAAGPVHLLKATDEFGGERGSACAVTEDGEMSGDYFGGETGIYVLEGGGEAEFDGRKLWGWGGDSEGS